MQRNPTISVTKNLRKTRNKVAIHYKWPDIFLENISNSKLQFMCITTVCVCLATGFLTLQVQLPVLRPHLRWGITAYYSHTNNSLSAHQPAGSQTLATKKGVRGVTLAPGCANSREVTFCRWLIHYLENLFTSCGFFLCPQLFSISFRPCISFFFCLSLSVFFPVS